MKYWYPEGGSTGGDRAEESSHKEVRAIPGETASKNMTDWWGANRKQGILYPSAKP